MHALLTDPCCVLGLAGAGFVGLLAAGAALIKGAHGVARSLRAARAVRDDSTGAPLNDGGAQ
jgi:hypothetical protein